MTTTPTGATTPRTTVVLPPDHNPKMRYPILIALPYTGGTATKFIRSYMGYWKSRKSLKLGFKLMLRKFYPRRRIRKKRGFILLLPPGVGSTRHHRWRGFRAAIVKFEKHIRTALARVTKIHKVDRNRVVLSGFSLGGDLSWALSLRNPQLISGAIIMGSRCSYRKRHAAKQLAARRVRFFLAMGGQEKTVRIKGMRRAKRLLDKAGVKYRYVTIPKPGHVRASWKTFRQALEYTLFR
jgi:predicted esterase